MGSFKVKLVAYFLLLSLLPLVAAFWGFSTVAARAETRRVDARLQAGLRATVAAYQQELAGADRKAEALAGNPVFARALVARNRAALEQLLKGDPNVAVVGASGFRVGSIARGAATRQLSIVGSAGVRGTIISSVPLDAALVHRLETHSGLDPHDHVMLVSHGRVAGGPGDAIGATLGGPAGATRTVRLGHTRYRLVTAGTLAEQPTATLAVASRQAAIDAANHTAVQHLLIGLLASLILVAGVAYVEGRSIVRTIRRLVDAARAIARGDLEQRVPVQGRDELALLGRTFNQMAVQLQTRLDELDAERRRLNEAIARFGDVLAATHDIDQLRRVIVETAIEATGAVGGVLVAEGGELVQSGDPDKGATKIEAPLVAGRINFGSLLVFGDEFEPDDKMTLSSLAAQAVIELDNARPHRIVERQARVDGLTGLANRRQLEDQLATELSRVERFGGTLSVVLADLDDFKRVNDRYGHPAGDVVLREFARTLEEGSRDIDTVGRWGGEEFVLLLPGTNLDGAAQLAERIRRSLEERLIHAGGEEPIPTTASFGVAAFSAPATAEAVLAAADSALYAAKRGGKNRVASPPETLQHA